MRQGMNEREDAQGAVMNRSVERAVSVLKVFENASYGLTFTEIWQNTGLSKATASRVVSTLAALDFLDYNETSRRYVLGPAILRLGLTAMRGLDLVTVSHPIMEQLQLSCKQSVALYVRRKSYKICLSKIEREEGICYVPEVGCPLSLWRGASGIVLLSELELADLDQILEKAAQEVTDNEVPDCQYIRDAVEATKRDGFCFSTRDYGYGVYNLAVPVKTFGGKVEASLNIAGTAQEFTQEHVAAWKILLQTAAGNISTRMGYSEKSE